MIPGRNNLALALQLITPQTVTLHRFAGRTVNPAGVPVPSFDPPVTIPRGSVQPVPAARYEQLGLDRTKRYVQWWVPADLFGLARDRNPDEFEWNGGRYQVTQETGWYPQDGWCVVIGVLISGGAQH